MHDAPKCLLEFGGRTLLERHYQNLADFDVRHVTLVVGYRSELVTRHLDDIETLPTLVLANPFVPPRISRQPLVRTADLAVRG